MGKYLIAWILGVPAFVLVIIYLLFNWSRSHPPLRGLGMRSCMPRAWLARAASAPHSEPGRSQASRAPGATASATKGQCRGIAASPVERLSAALLLSA